jgi:N-acyl-phosphatidylethanolamine-hydrolysing phospholipase D
LNSNGTREQQLGRNRSHHHPKGGFRNPWPGEGGADRGLADLLRWRWQRIREPVARAPAGDAFPRAEPQISYPAAPAAEIRITWIGHASFLLQIGGCNVLTDPHFSERASPAQWFGPRRLTAPGLVFEQLPPIHAVILSHDHYDHLDSPTLRRIARTFPRATWLAPLGHEALVRSLGARDITEFDWWQAGRLEGATLEVQALPVQHWTRRIGSPPSARLWCSWSLQSENRRIYFAGDSGYCPAFAEIGRQAGPFDAALLPIGAYEPRWFMQPAHMNPEEAVAAYGELRAEHFVAMHWGTFRLTDEHPLEPPERVRAAWAAAGLPPGRLHVLAIGETLVL